MYQISLNSVYVTPDISWSVSERGFNVKSLFDETALYLNNQYTYNYKFKNKVWRNILKGGVSK